MNKKRILFDIDGVFAKYADYYLNYLNWVFDLSFTYDDVVEFDMEKALNLNDFQRFIVERWKTKPGFAENLDVEQDVVDTIILLDTVADVYFLTSHLSSNPTWVYERDKWLIKHFGKQLGRKVIYTKHKHVVSGDVFVDDCYENVAKWSESNPKGLAYLWNTPWNTQFQWDRRLSNIDFKKLQIELLKRF